MLDTPWVNVDEGILSFREREMLEWIHCVKPNPPQWKDPEDMPSTNSIRHKMERAPAHLKSFVVVFFLLPGLLAGDAIAQMHELNALCQVGSQGSWDQVEALNYQGQGDLI